MQWGLHKGLQCRKGNAFSSLDGPKEMEDDKNGKEVNDEEQNKGSCDKESEEVDFPRPFFSTLEV